MHRITDDERRRRLGRRHCLASPASSVDGAARALIGLHSSDPVTPFLSALARVAAFEVSDLERALYDERTLARILGMRRTLFVVPVDLTATIDAACTSSYVERERKRTLKLLSDEGIADDPEAWLEDVEQRVLQVLLERGAAAAAQLTEAVPELGARFSYGEGKAWGGTQSIVTRVMFLLATDGRIVRGRPRGSWLSSQYRWAPTATWYGDSAPSVLDRAPRDPTRARAELARLWLGAFGPGTLLDLKWWTGWTVTEARAALKAVDAVAVELVEGEGYLLPDDLEPDPGDHEPWVALLPALDPTVMGWKERVWYLGDHDTRLFDRNGNAGPTILCDGRVVGGWVQTPSGEIAMELLSDVGSDSRDLISSEAHRLALWLGDTRITPRFRTPVEKELLAGV